MKDELDKIKSITSEINKKHLENIKLRDAIVAKIQTIKQNPDVIQSFKNGIIVSSKDIGANIPWTAEYHDFRISKNTLADVLSKTSPHMVIHVLNEVIDSGRIKLTRNRTVRVHPNFIEQIKEMLK